MVMPLGFLFSYELFPQSRLQFGTVWLHLLGVGCKALIYPEGQGDSDQKGAQQLQENILPQSMGGLTQTVNDQNHPV